MNYENSYSLADIAAATGNNGRNNYGFGSDGNWAWVLIFLIFALGGFGRNGYGFGGTGSVSDNYVLASDFATLQRQLSDSFGNLTAQSRYIQNGLCDGFYAMNTSLLNGFAGTNNAIMTNGYETRNAINNVSAQLADCCCKTQSAIQGVNYNMAMNTNAIQNAMCLNTRDLIENQNANYRALHDEIVANRIEDKNAQITAQQNEINALRLAASQEKQNSFLIHQLNPTPVPSYPVVNPNCCLNYQVTNGCCGNGCNCGNY